MSMRKKLTSPLAVVQQLAAALPRGDASQRAAFEGRLSGDAGGAKLLRPSYAAQPPPALTWDLFQDDGQVTSKPT